jgi:hypothetical protein
MSAIAPPITESSKDQGDSSLIQESNEPLATRIKVEDTTAPMDVDKDDGDDGDGDGNGGDNDVAEDGNDGAVNDGDDKNNDDDNDNDDGDDKNEDASKSEESKQRKVDPPPSTSPTPSQTLDVDLTKTAPELSDEDKNAVKDSEQGLVLGGTVGKKAYALLTGKFKVCVCLCETLGATLIL